MDEDTWDILHAGLSDYFLNAVKKGYIPPEKACMGCFSYDYRTHTGVVMLLDESLLGFLKEAVSRMKMHVQPDDCSCEEDEWDILTFTAFGAYDLHRQPVYARIDRLGFI